MKVPTRHITNVKVAFQKCFEISESERLSTKRIKKDKEKNEQGKKIKGEEQRKGGWGKYTSSKRLNRQGVICKEQEGKVFRNWHVGRPWAGRYLGRRLTVLRTVPLLQYRPFTRYPPPTSSSSFRRFLPTWRENPATIALFDLVELLRPHHQFKKEVRVCREQLCGFY